METRTFGFGYGATSVPLFLACPLMVFKRIRLRFRDKIVDATSKFLSLIKVGFYACVIGRKKN